MRSRVLLGVLFGAIGGFLGFALQEWRVPHLPDVDPPMRDQLYMGLLIGAMLGLGIGAIEGVVVGSASRLRRGLVLGALVGALGGVFGMYFGSIAFRAALFGKPLVLLESSPSIADFVHVILARAVSWTFVGALPGLAAGAATLSSKRAWHGLVGGLLGGFIGGLLFEPLAKVVAPIIAPAAAASGKMVFEAGGASRALGLTVIGALTGLFIGLVEEALKQAWVRVLVGRNEGRDYIISKPLTVLGRDERADVPLFGDPNLAPQHAAVKMEHGRHMLVDGGTPIGAMVNGQRVQEPLLLRDGDMIQLGQVRLLFREKATAVRVHRPAADAPKSPASPGAVNIPATHCPFCGAAKDPSGNCLCTVPGAGPAPGAALPGGAPGLGAAPSAVEPGTGYGAAPAPTWASGAGIASALQGAGSRLVCLEGPYAGQAFALTGPNVGLGRDPGQTIALTDDKTISRRHAHIAEDSGQHVLYDDGSSNGTFVNSIRVSVQPLAPGDILQLGASKFRYE